MLYFEDESRDQWPAIVRVLVCVEALDMVLCLYPGDDFSEDSGPFTEAPFAEPLERIAGYEGSDSSDCSIRVRVNEALLTWLEERIDEFEEWGESLALYPPARTELAAAVIPSEGVIIVDDRFGSALDAAGIRFSPDSPEWWQHD